MTRESDHDAPPLRPAAEAQPEVVFYWRPGCMFCWSLRRRLRRAGVAFDERNIRDDPDAAAYVRWVTGGDETVPTVVVDGLAFVNPSADKVLALLPGRRPG